ncbi:MAG TPA: PIN domain nuclease [Blastocatellia bacterium]|nr:PIN domain nuclease [Blastocatellia bacterium]
MSWAVDTNVLLRTTDIGDAAQPVAEAAMVALRRGGESLSIFPQNLIEFWAVATRPTINNGLGLSVAQAESQVNNLKDMFLLLDDTPEIFSAWERIVRRYQVIGKQAHDARLVAAMKVHSLTHLLTFNDRDFKRFTEITVINPQNIT